MLAVPDESSQQCDIRTQAISQIRYVFITPSHSAPRPVRLRSQALVFGEQLLQFQKHTFATLHNILEAVLTFRVLRLFANCLFGFLEDGVQRKYFNMNLLERACGTFGGFTYLLCQGANCDETTNAVFKAHSAYQWDRKEALRETSSDEK